MLADPKKKRSGTDMLFAVDHALLLPMGDPFPKNRPVSGPELINIKGGVAKEGFLPVKTLLSVSKTNNAKPKGNQYDRASDGRNRPAQQQPCNRHREPGRPATQTSEVGLRSQAGGRLSCALQAAAQKCCRRIDLQLVLAGGRTARALLSSEIGQSGADRSIQRHQARRRQERRLLPGGVATAEYSADGSHLRSAVAAGAGFVASTHEPGAPANGTDAQFQKSLRAHDRTNDELKPAQRHGDHRSQNPLRTSGQLSDRQNSEGTHRETGSEY